MKKILCLGECSLSIILDSEGHTLGTLPGGRITNAALLLARSGMPVAMASEAANDVAGDIVTGALARAGVDISAVDRYSNGNTPATLVASVPAKISRYDGYPEGDEGFDIVWPRLDEGDIVLFGGHYALAQRSHANIANFLNYAAERKAVKIYLPGFLPVQEPRITRVMPQLLENLESADIVVTRSRDLPLLFGTDSAASCYDQKVNFYCRSLVNIDAGCRRMEFFAGKDMTSVELPETALPDSMIWNAGAAAGIAAELLEDASPLALTPMPADLRERVLGAAVRSASAATKGLEPWMLAE